ncbi:hypothetical protein AGR9A_Cc70232 [Agrobacterium salinitolerans str. Hayward 0363]|nr:hypothetical protein AGR9A_Cc70232 [Agrobacterium salinitolerans str. Hayward 0363]
MRSAGQSGWRARGRAKWLMFVSLLHVSLPSRLVASSEGYGVIIVHDVAYQSNRLSGMIWSAIRSLVRIALFAPSTNC